jgi:hypothetical protein
LNLSGGCLWVVIATDSRAEGFGVSGILPIPAMNRWAIFNRSANADSEPPVA